MDLSTKYKAIIHTLEKVDKNIVTESYYFLSPLEARAVALEWKKGKNFYSIQLVIIQSIEEIK